MPEDFLHHEAPKKVRGIWSGLKGGGEGVLSSTSDDSSLEILFQKVDVICVMDKRHFILKPLPLGQMDGQTDGRMDGRIDRQTDGRTGRWMDRDGWMDGWVDEWMGGR